MSVRILIGDCRDKLGDLPDASVHCCVTSPPYFGLRDYGVAGQMGLEPTPDEFVAGMVEVFREVRRVLRDDGTLWLNIGDSYAANRTYQVHNTKGAAEHTYGKGSEVPPGCKPKDLIGIPWKLAEALKAPYYTGRIKSELDRVWLAAMMDGEGSISGFVHERSDGTGIRTGVNVCLTNTCEKMLAKAAEIWPACLVPHAMNNDRLGNRPVYRWKPNGAENIGDFLAELYPYLLTKKVQAALAWNLMQFSKDGQAWGKSAVAGEVRDKRTLLAGMISELNKGGSPVIPDWVKEPPSLYEPGWYLRQEIIWAKPNPMPESVRDRCTKAHEQIFLLSKSPRYFFDAEAIAEDAGGWNNSEFHTGKTAEHQLGRASVKRGGFNGKTNAMPGREAFRAVTEQRNKRSVWTVTTQPYSEAHFATYPPALVEPCILAGCPRGGTVLDPFGGAGTTGLVADRLGRNAILIELNPEYAEIAERRLNADGGMFAEVRAA